MPQRQRKLTHPKANDLSSTRLCPVCACRMEIRVVQGIEVEVCPDHGIWLDRGELQAIVQRKGTKRAIAEKDRLRNARRGGKVDGWIWGPLAFLFD